MNLREKLNYIINTENKSDIKYQISKYIVDCTNTKKYPNINDIATHCFIAKSSIVRFCKSLGLDGYKSFINKLKFEDERNYKDDSVEILKTLENNKFDILKNSLINFLFNSNSFLNSLDNLKNLILNCNRIFIFSSYELEDVTSILNDYLLLTNKPVIYSKYKKTSNLILDNIEENDLQIFLIAGVDNSYIRTIYNYSKANLFSKKVVISSDSQIYKFKESDLEIVIDFKDDYTSIHDKELKLIYLFKQLSILLNENNEQNNFFSTKHIF